MKGVIIDFSNKYWIYGGIADAVNQYIDQSGDDLDGMLEIVVQKVKDMMENEMTDYIERYRKKISRLEEFIG